MMNRFHFAFKLIVRRYTEDLTIQAARVRTTGGVAGASTCSLLSSTSVVLVTGTTQRIPQFCLH